MHVNAYLMFDGRCEEALNFYKEKIGAEIGMKMTFGESPDQTMVAPGTEGKIMHAEFKVGETTIFASDGMCTGNANFSGVSLTISVKDKSESERIFNALQSDGGQVHMPLTETFFSPSFGMVADKFGLTWMVIVDKER
jgi:PhnB protein